MRLPDMAQVVKRIKGRVPPKRNYRSSRRGSKNFDLDLRVLEVAGLKAFRKMPESRLQVLKRIGNDDRGH
ncbi:hypothetical protein [Sinorhizobium fredii]|uniref:hypothetical protein n=1 Tax=Rhizobium fredii TaxID=380 RepID=UPI000CF24135|nr:hypothetical protein [Sinorhizobium fredii]